MEFSHWNWKPSRQNILGLFGKKLFVLGLAFLIIASAFAGMYADKTNPLFHSLQANNDPVTYIWHDTCGDCNNNLLAWNVYSGNNGGKVVYKANCMGGGIACIDIGSDTSITSVSLTKVSIGELGVVAGKVLYANQNWESTASTFGTNVNFGWYLTTNSTVPTHAIGSSSAYDPKADSSVSLVEQMSCTTSCGVSGSTVIQSNLYFLRNLGHGDTISSEDTGCSGQAGSPFLCLASTGYNPSNAQTSLENFLNFTGPGVGPGGQSSCSTSTFAGSACSFLTAHSQQTQTATLPWLNYQSQQFYLGIYVMPGLTSEVYWNFNTPTVGLDEAMSLMYYVPNPTATVQGPQIDTGGIFGPVIKALIGLGVYILNALYGFVGVIVPALETALGLLQGVLKAMIDFLGNLLWPNSNIGTLLFNFLNAIIQFFTNGSYGLPAFFANFPSYFTNFLNWLQIVFPFITPVFSISNAILLFAVNGIATFISIFTIGLQMFLFGFGTLMMAMYFVYTGDDGIGGLLTYLGTLEALSFKVLNLIATLTNLGLDILITLVSLIPKPFIQMNASKLPRLPVLETGASLSWPTMDFGEARNGNIVPFWLWSIGLYMVAWFESRNPSLPGSIGALFPSAAANMRILAGLLPLLQAMVLISGGIMVLWFAMLSLRIAGFDILSLSPIGVGLGRRTGAGPTGITVSAGKKRVIGPARKAEKERERRKQFIEKKVEEARSGIEKAKSEEEKKKLREELRQTELARKPTGKDIRGPDLT